MSSEQKYLSISTTKLLALNTLYAN